MNINDIITNALTNILNKGLPFMGGTIDLASCVISITFSFVAIAYVYSVWSLCRDTSGFSKKRLACLNKRMDTKKWDFTTNWIGPVTTLLSVVAATQLNGANTPGSSQFVSLSLFFGMIMIIAPLLHNAACKMQNNVTSKKSQYKVKALIFLVTSAFSLWAILGGAITIMLLLEAPVRVENSALFMLVLLVVVGLAIWQNTHSTYELIYKHINDHLEQAASPQPTQVAENSSVSIKPPDLAITQKLTLV